MKEFEITLRVRVELEDEDGWVDIADGDGYADVIVDDILTDGWDSFNISGAE